MTVRDRLYQTLEIPWVYRLVQEVAAPGAGWLLTRVAREAFGDSRGPVLDVGCGPELSTPRPVAGLLCGVDISLRYTWSYGSHPDPRQVAVRASAERLPFGDGAFAECRCWGLLHHLPPAVASGAVAELVRCARPGGRVVIGDAVWPRRAWTRPVAWLGRRLDRGEWVREEHELLELIQAAAPGAWRHRRFTYTVHGLEGLLLTLEVPR